MGRVAVGEIGSSRQDIGFYVGVVNVRRAVEPTGDLLDYLQSLLRVENSPPVKPGVPSDTETFCSRLETPTRNFAALPAREPRDVSIGD